MQPPGLINLREAASAAAKRFGTFPEAAFDPCGLILFGPDEAYPYWCTPENVTTFARTGGDGVHYSYLNAHGPGDFCVIVMTVPMASSAAAECNIVSAESFREFFSLGFYVGWFSLEQLIYQREDALEYFRTHDPNQSDYCKSRLEFIRDALAIQPQPPTAARLASLVGTYHEQLNLPSGEA